MKNLLLILMFIFLFENFTFSNDGYLGTLSSNLIKFEKLKNDSLVKSSIGDSIQMVEEIIYLKLLKDSAIVKCKFIFKNHGEQKMVKIGFPDIYYDPDFQSMPLRNFKSTVNNVPVSLDYYHDQFTIDTFLINNSSSIIDTTLGNTYYTKDVLFKKNSEVVIEDYYIADYSKNNTFEASLTYILGTGASWFKNIKKGTLIFDHTDYLSNNFQLINENNLKLSKKIKQEYTPNLTIFSFENYKPDSNDIFTVGFKFADIIYKNSYFNLDDTQEEVFDFSYFGINEFVEEKNYTKNDVINIIDEIEARNGKIFTDSKKSEYFNKQIWYKPKKEYERVKISKLENYLLDYLFELSKTLPVSSKRNYKLLPNEHEFKYKELLKQININ